MILDTDLKKGSDFSVHADFDTKDICRSLFFSQIFLSCHGLNCTKQSSRFLFLQHRLPFLCHLQDVKRYKLGHPKTFHYLNQSNCYELDGVDDSEEYIATRRAMEVVGMSSNEQV